MLTTEQFTWDRGRNELVAEASSLGFRAGEKMPETIQVQSHKTGDVKTFSNSAAFKHGGDDVLGWRFYDDDGSTLTLFHRRRQERT